MSQTRWTLFVEPQAPAKPAFGAPCNGCGICCLAQPCPLGMLLSRRRQGACGALRWDAETEVYRCGAVAHPQAVLENALPTAARGLAPLLARGLAAAAPRWIGAGRGCDSTLLMEASTIGAPGAARVAAPPPDSSVA